MKKTILLFIFISLLAFSGKAQIMNCGNFCILSINNVDTTGANTIDVTIYNGDTNSVNYPTIVVTNSIGDTVVNKYDYFYLFQHPAGDTVTQTLPTTLDSIPSGFTGTVYLTDRIYDTTCSYSYPMACSVGIHEAISNNYLTVYPNPVTTTINISMNEMREAYYSLYDCTGKEVKHFSSSLHENSIDRGGLPNGIYFMNVLVGDKLLTKKIILE